MIINRYTYQLTWDGFSLPVHPSEDNVRFPWRKREHMAYFRREMDGELVFGKGEYSIFAFANWDTEFTITMNRNGYEFYVGKFRKYDCAIDLDKCTARVTPPPYDEYYDFVKQMDEEINILKSGLRRKTVNFTFSTYDTEKYIDITNVAAVQLPPTSPVNDTNSYLLYQREYKPSGAAYIQVDEYWREYLILPTGVAAPSNEGWDSGTPQGNGTVKFVRPYLNILPSSSNLYLSTVVGGVVTQTIEVYSSMPGSAPYERSLLLNSVVGVFLTGLPMTYESSFFKDGTNYVCDVTGYPTGVTTNPLQYLHIMQKSDARETTNEATRGMLSFTQLMDILYGMFQVEWWIDDDKLRIEHVAWKDINAVNGLDLTKEYHKKYIEKKNAFSYDPDIPKSETWEFMEANGVDFIGLPIEYDYPPDGEMREYNLNSVTTDVIFIKASPGKISDDGWVIFQTYHVSGDEYNIGNEEGDITKVSGSNKHLSIANLHKRYWKHNRPLPQGIVNGKTVGFASSEKIKIQTDIKIPYTTSFDPNKLIKTELGWGVVVEAEHDIKSETLTMTLAYDQQ